MTDRLRVGFVLNSGGSHWLGGVNYMVNLIRTASVQGGIDPVILSGGLDLAPEFSMFSDLERYPTAFVAPSGPVWALRKGLVWLLGRDVLLERLLRSHRIDVLSHYTHLGSRSTFPTVTWIPDFQHEHLPHFFSANEIATRRAKIARMADAAHTVILSSAHAEADFRRLYPRARAQTRVMRFVSDVSGALRTAISLESLAATYHLTGPFFHLPNQFWIHKNHAVVIDALARIRAAGRRVTVVATGLTQDSRHPDHFKCLMARAAAAGCSEDFRVLGVVPHDVLTGLMVHSVALINPSRFEGWSTTIEEGKSIGKQLILSDIPVHREQAPRHGTYFGCDEPDALARAMIKKLDSHDPANEALRQAEAAAELPIRLSEFGRTYATILLETTAHKTTTC